MKTVPLLIATGLMLSSALVLAQQAPESLLPPGFEQPRTAPKPAERAPQPRPSPRPVPAAAPRVGAPPAGPPAAAPSPTAAQPLPVTSAGAIDDVPPAQKFRPGQIPPVEVLEKLSPDQLDEVLGLNGRGQIPAGARRSTAEAGVIDPSEGGFAVDSLSAQDASLVRAAIEGNTGELVSRWGHILLRRALASRLAPPTGMDAPDFAAMRAALLLRMGEADAARGLVQDIDPGDYTPALTASAFDTYVATGDFTGICPERAAQDGTRDDPPWKVAGYICDAFRGDTSGALQSLDRAVYRGLMPRIDLLLAQKYTGAAGKGARAVTIEWTGVNEMTPWRYGMTMAVGLEPPAGVMKDARPWYDWIGATAPMRGLFARVRSADRAAAAGVLSSAAMVDLYSQLFSDGDTGADRNGEWADRTGKLRDAYAAAAASDRLTAMQGLWTEVDDPQARYSRMVLTAYAAARLPASGDLAKASGDIIASMLAAGLDANAARWANVVGSGSQGWALLALATPGAAPVDASAVEDFAGSDASTKQRKAAFLIAGLAGLGRLPLDRANELSGKVGSSLGGDTRWTRIIDKAAAVNNPELVALLVGVGMQGDSWSRMTPRFLYHIVAALRSVGLEPEARMIAAEAVARA